MNNIGKILFRGIIQNEWIKIEYKNKNDEITSFMIGINDINLSDNTLLCDCFNIEKSKETLDVKIYFNSILNADSCEYTYHQTPLKLIDDIEKNRLSYKIFEYDYNGEDIIEYYIKCYKLDNTPYVKDKVLIPGIDSNSIVADGEYILNETQFEILAKQSFYEKQNKLKNKEQIIENLVCNVISMDVRGKGLYVLAYKQFLLDIKEKKLKASNQIFINREFMYNSESEEVELKDSINSYLPEEDYYLLDNIDNNLNDVIHSLREYNKSLYNRVLIDTKPYIIALSSKQLIDIAKELNGIKEMIYDKSLMTYPIQTFFGENFINEINDKPNPIFVFNEKFDIDQINAIHEGLKSHCSYIQGPPGTGKTQTLLNALLTSLMNNKTVLVTSNNNIPMDGIYAEIQKLEYRPGSPLLFPAIRLGNNEKCVEAIKIMNSMFNRAKNLPIKEDYIKKIKDNKISSMDYLVAMLSNHNKIIELKEKKEGLLKLLENDQNTMFSINLQVQLDEVEKKLKSLKEVDINEFKNNVMNDDKKLFMAIEFETASRLKMLKEEEYSDLLSIISYDYDADLTENAIQLRKYLKDDENFRKFLKIFPIVISTNSSCGYLGRPRPQFDIVMMDEAGQCDIACSLIPITRARNLMLVGDPQQLNPIILLDPNINKVLKKRYNVPDEYDYISNSIYSLYTKVDLVGNETLLSHHYRCNEKIIDFSNKKYYHNKLKIKSKSKEEKPLLFVDTSKLDNEKSLQKNVSEVEAKYIVEYLKNNPNEDVGIITPFVKQKEMISEYLKHYNINNASVGTVHSYQGEQKDVIILSSAISNSTYKGTYEWLKDNRELINVAVSRPKNKLIVLGNKKAVDKLANDTDDFKELIEYVKNNGSVSITDVSIPSLALGTRQLNDESEKELKETVGQILSVINPNSSIITNCKFKDVFKYSDEYKVLNDEVIDLLIYEKGANQNHISLVIQMNLLQALSKEETDIRLQKKKQLFNKYNIQSIHVSREYARDYISLKNTIVKLFEKNIFK